MRKRISAGFSIEPIGIYGLLKLFRYKVMIIRLLINRDDEIQNAGMHAMSTVGSWGLSFVKNPLTGDSQ